MKLKLFLLINSIIFIFSLVAEPYLFKKFPLLQNHIPHIHLCDLPTPIVKLQNFSDHVGCPNLFMKRDDLSGARISDDMRLYGGNKPRKLEFLLADAINHDAHTIITFGCAGSNHALATAVYAHTLGLQTILMLKPQPNSSVVRHNLLLDHYYGAQLQFFSNNVLRSLAANEIIAKDAHAYLIPTGGSNTIGMLGFVNAALELASQIEENIMPEPDLIYIATGSCASTAGLLLGLQLAQVKSRVVAVCIEPQENDSAAMERIKQLFVDTNILLHNFDETVYLIDFPEEQLILNKKFCGIQYGLAIPEGIEAMRLFKETENIVLDGTYSSRPVAALIDDCKQGVCNDKVVLFWNTFCGIDFSDLVEWDSYKKLPVEFHTYFEEN